MAPKNIADEKVHESVRRAFESGTPRDRENAKRLASRRIVDGKPFFGYGDLHTYLKQHHGIEYVKQSARTSETELHARVQAGLEKGIVSSKQWSGYARTRIKLLGAEPGTIYSKVQEWVKDGKRFKGYGSWDAYLEHEHGIIPVDQKRWSDKRLHAAIAAALKKYSMHNWKQKEFEIPGAGGKTLRSLYESVRTKSFFGHGTWQKYIEWVRKNYAT